MTIGEVINVDSLTNFQIQQTEGGEDVQLGKFVYVEKHHIIGVLGDITILNPDIGSYPRPKRMPDNIEITSVYPDLLEQFPTIINVYVLGYKKDNEYIQEIPFRPPSIYTKVRFASDEEIRDFHVIGGATPQISYLIRLQEFEKTPVLDALLRIVLGKVANLFDITIEDILDVMS